MNFFVQTNIFLKADFLAKSAKRNTIHDINSADQQRYMQLTTNKEIFEMINDVIRGIMK